jgi:hypothetical protein
MPAVQSMQQAVLPCLMTTAVLWPLLVWLVLLIHISRSWYCMVQLLPTRPGLKFCRLGKVVRALRSACSTCAVL